MAVVISKRDLTGERSEKTFSNVIGISDGSIPTLLRCVCPKSGLSQKSDDRC